MKEIGTGTREIFLGNGTFAAPTSEEKIHNYTLELYFPVTGGDQSHDQSKSFEGHIEIREGTITNEPYLNDYIISQYGGSSSITSLASFSSVSGSTDNLMYKILDNYGMSHSDRDSIVYDAGGLRPAVSLVSATKITSGNGASSTLYIIQTT